MSTVVPVQNVILMQLLVQLLMKITLVGTLPPTASSDAQLVPIRQQTGGSEVITKFKEIIKKGLNNKSP
jgi:hypothetical protein